METKFNFKSSPCASREQSKRLLALGIKKETADMHYRYFGRNSKGEVMHYSEPSVGRPYSYDVPAWSLHRILMMLDYDVQTDGRYISLPAYGFVKNDNIYDNLCDCIEWLIKEGYFPKEYLV